jgi:AraC-like DNA-binding protein
VAIDRNARARLIWKAEALDRRTHEPGRHGGRLRRTGVQVLRTLLLGFANAVTGRCDPSLDALARLAGMARSTVAEALNRLEAEGLVRRVQRRRAVRANGGVVVVQISNVYLFPMLGEPQKPPASGNRTGTYHPTSNFLSASSMPQPGAAPGERMGHLLAALLAREKRLGLA